MNKRNQLSYLLHVALLGFVFAWDAATSYMDSEIITHKMEYIY